MKRKKILETLKEQLKQTLKLLMIMCVVLTSACELVDDDEKSKPGPTVEPGPEPPVSESKGYAIVATAANDYSSGAFSVVTYEKPRKATNNLLPTHSDNTLATYGKYFYRIDRKNGNIVKFHIDKPTTPVWQYLTQDSGEANSNPHALIFVNETKAYITRYEKSTVWIVNPSAQSEDDFKIGEIDLSAYVAAGDTDGDPEIENAVIVNDKLYIIMQRLTGWTVERDAYIAVINVNNDTEIDTGQGEGGLKGIKLTVQNPANITCYGDNLYVSAPGDYFSSGGGLQLVNHQTYVADSGLVTTNYIMKAVIVSDTKGYFIQYSFGDSKVISFNPSTKAIGAELSGLGNDFSDIELDNSGKLWVADHTDVSSGLFIFNTSNDILEEGSISTNLAPLKIVFCDI